MPLALLAALLLALAEPAGAATFTVTSNLDSGPNTLRQAIVDANADGTADSIAFAIDTGAVTIALDSALPAIVYPVTIDGTTQPGFAGTPIVELDGANVPAGGDGLTLSSHSGSTIRGLVIDRFPGDSASGGNGIVISGGGGHTIEGNYIGTDIAGTASRGNGRDGITVSLASGCVIGGETTAARNLISANVTAGIRFAGAGSNQVRGNWIGVTASGSVSLGNGTGILVLSNGGVGSTSNTIGGDLPADANVISANGDGITVGNDESSPTTIKGNLIGTDSTGTVVLGNTGVGIRVNSAPAVTIDGNVVAGSATGIDVVNLGSDGTVIRSNAIGTDPSGTADLGNGTGVHVGVGLSGAPVGATIGGAGTGNVIAHNTGAGIAVDSGLTGGAVFVSPTAIEIRSNQIFANGALGIDLEGDGVTPNDALDADDGANGLQNFPVVTGVVDMGDMFEFTGTLDAAANTTYTVELFSNTAADPSGNGEGQSPLGTTMVPTDGTGHGDFDVLLPVAVSPGEFVTATATDPGHDTSEFSAAFEVGVTTTTSTSTSTSTSTEEPTTSSSSSTTESTTTTTESTTSTSLAPTTTSLASTTTSTSLGSTTSTSLVPTTTSTSLAPTTTSTSLVATTTTTTTSVVPTTSSSSTTLPGPSTSTTTTTTTTAPPTTTTTIPCSMSQPLTGIECRVNALEVRVGQESALAPVAAKLLKALDQARTRVEDVRETCLIGKTSSAKRKLARASRALAPIAKILKSKKAKSAPQDLRDEITSLAAGIRSDLGLIKIGLTCP